jgi:DNA-binding FadR family transcriptional regulator
MVNVREASQQKADQVINYFKAQIEAGEWLPGHKLPTEKALITQFSAARNTVRKALASLEQDGIIVRHVGRGTFVRDEQNESDSTNTTTWSEASPAEINETRVLLEPAIANLVVSKATQSDINYAKKCLENTLIAKDIAEYEQWDAELHSTIIKATKNNMLINIYAAIHQARQRMEWHELKRRSLTKKRRENYDNEHGNIVTALSNRDAVALQQALKTHLQSVSHNMLNPATDQE